MSITRFKIGASIQYSFAVTGGQVKKRAEVRSHVTAVSFSGGTACRI